MAKKNLLLNRTDIDFIRAQLDLPGNDPRNAPLGTILDAFGIRDVSGVGNNVLNPLFGQADQPFPRLTPATYGNAQGTFTIGQAGFTQVPNPTSYAVRDVNLYDTSPRIISNLVANQSDAALAAIGYTTDAARKLAVQDDPTSTPDGRLSPLTGNTNPLPYSSFLTFVGQFFDHGLDLVSKGADGLVLVPILPGDELYNHPDNAIPGAPGQFNNFFIASRSNTVHVDIGVSSTDTLVAALGLNEDRYTTGDPGVRAATVTGDQPISADIAKGGVLLLNNVAINIARDATQADVIAAINAQSQTTGVTAATDAGNHLVLTFAAGESTNSISPFVDLSQSYGSVASHTAFLREYDKYEIQGLSPTTGKFEIPTGVSKYIITGRLVSGADSDLDGLADGMANWANLKANALVVGVTLHDKDVFSGPQVRMTAEGVPYIGDLGAAHAGMWLIAREKVSGQIYYVQDSTIGLNNKGLVLNADGTTTLLEGAAFTAVKSQLILQTTGHAFLNDMANGLFGTESNPLRNLNANGDIDAKYRSNVPDPAHPDPTDPNHFLVRVSTSKGGSISQ